MSNEYGQKKLKIATIAETILEDVGSISTQIWRCYRGDRSLPKSYRPQSPPAFLGLQRLGDLCSQQERLDKAISAYTEAIKLKPEEPAVYRMLAASQLKF